MTEPVVAVADFIIVEWPMVDDTFKKFRCRVCRIEKCRHVKKGSAYKYELLFDDGDLKRTRLLNLKWELENKDRDSTITKKDIKCVNGLPPHRYILAPMVGGSELAFRMLCRKYGAQLAYTPMMNSERFAMDASYRESEFQTIPADRPLVAHFSGNNPAIMLTAAKFIEDKCDAIDLNLGCPQRIAYAGHFGSYLLDKEDRDLIVSIISTLSKNISIPIFVKIRLLNTIEETIELCQQLAHAGANLIAIHARYRVNLVGRTGPGARDGPAHLDQVAVIKKAIPHIPIIANGNVKSWDDVVDNLNTTGADGIMSAEGLLDDPTLFAPALSDQTGTTLTALTSTSKDKLQVALEYLNLATLYPVKIKSIIFHIRRICRNELIKYQLLEECLTARNIEIIRNIILQAISYEINNNYIYDSYKAKQEKNALQRKKFEEGKRKRYEERMIRKAKREKKDLNFYLEQGALNPTAEELEELKAMNKEQSFDIWKERHSQHCYAFHLEKNGCPRDRTCSFLHMDASMTETEPLAYG
eukprot:gene4909-9790_t